MIKVAHICTSRKSYKILEDKLINLSKLGYEVSIISSREGDYEGKIYKDNNINQYYVDMDRNINLIKDIKSILKMKKLLKEKNFDIVHTHTAKAGIIGRISAKLAKTKLIVHTSHGLPFFEGQNFIKYHIYKVFEIIGTKFCDYVGSQNYEDLNHIKTYVKKDRLFYEGNGVDLERLDNIYKNINEDELKVLKESLNISEETMIFLKAARLEGIKNHDLLIQSLKELKNRGYDDFCCLFAGEGDREKDLRTKVKELDLDKHIIFLGQREDIYKFIKMADITLLTSHKEGIPRIIMESMSFYKPTIATNVLGTKELVVHEKTGLLSSDNDINQLTDNLEKIYNNRHLIEILGNNGRKRVEELFTEQIVAKRIDKLYKNGLKSVN